MNPAVVGNDVRRHREDACVSRFVEHIHTDPGQCAIRCDQPIVHAMYARDKPTHAGQLEVRHRSTGEDARTRAGGDERAHRRRGQLYIGVKVDPRKRTDDGVPQHDRVCFTGCLGFDDPYARSPSNLGRTVMARVGDDDDVELVRLGAHQKGAEISPDDAFLVVSRHDDTDRRSRRIGRHRRAAHAVFHATPLIRVIVTAPLDTISAGASAERSDLRNLSSMHPTTVRPRPHIHDRFIGVTVQHEGAT
jgi:hypothetical protein